MKNFVVVLAAATLLVVAGCSRPDQMKISGNVSYDGVPVANGSIGFTAGNGAGTIYGGDIKGGRYRVSLAPGDTYRVSIDGTERKKLDKPFVNDIGQTIEYQDVSTIPGEYNENSSLSVEVTREKKVYDFDLTVPVSPK